MRQMALLPVPGGSCGACMMSAPQAQNLRATAASGNRDKDGRGRRDLLSALVAANKTNGLRNLANVEGVYPLRVQATDSRAILDVQASGAPCVQLVWHRHYMQIDCANIRELL